MTSKIKPFTFLLFSIGYLISQAANAQVSFTTKQWRLQLDAKGRITSMKSLALQKEYLVAQNANALLSIRVRGNIIAPQSCAWKSKTSELVLAYPTEGVEATVRVKQETSYVSFTLKHLTNTENVELILWGPYPTSIADTIGEVVGVVRDKHFAIGIQALNIKTLGGYPNAESDIEPSYDIFETASKTDVGASDLNKQLFRGDVARPTEFGSVLQAYCRNRNKDRIIENWKHQSYFAPSFKDGGVIGSAIALFGAGNKDVLAVLGEIELTENLPHPLLDGVWGKQAVRASESYLIMAFGSDNLQEAIDVTQKAGLRYLYHPDPFENWGHFQLRKKDFPQNWESLKVCVDKANEKNIRLGVHTLSNFITTNDPYVTPQPDPGLAKVGFSQLTGNIDATSGQIGIKDPTFFNQFENNTLSSVVIGNEIIRYGSVSKEAPWRLLDCQRGSFGTTAAAHLQNDSIGKLMDHPYKVFLTSFELQEKMAKTIAQLFNQTGLMQISFDGLEGCWSTGMGQYARQLFAKTWYDNLRPELKGKVINDASNPGHYFWHIYTRMNWGEPWYAGFRESQLQLRLKNQQFFRRNLMPSMLGWFNLRPETTPEDIQWMLALGAGYNAGFGLSLSMESLRKHGKKDEILGMIKVWEEARLKGVFNEEQRERMRSLKNEFHLEAIGNNQYKLTPVYNAYFTHVQQLKQPGEPTFSTFNFENKGLAQPMAFMITIVDSKEKNTDEAFNNLSISINNQDFAIPVNLEKNQIIYCDGRSIKLYDRQWQLLKTIEAGKPLPLLKGGTNQIHFNANYPGENGADLKMEIRAKGKEELIRKQTS